MSDFTIIELDTTDSTNNYAMQLIDANKAQHGLTIVARTQTGGRGQRGKTWQDRPGEALLMSIVVVPGRDLASQFTFNAAVAVGIAKVLQKLTERAAIHIKWPNDVIVNDKKAGGVLIENVLRGSNWVHSVIGIGLNVKQDQFPGSLPHATSLKMATGMKFDVMELCEATRKSVLAQLSIPGNAIMDDYNSRLFRRYSKQGFRDAAGAWEAGIRLVRPDGELEVELDNGTIVAYQHGQVEWVWG